ncbi:tRNA (adenosine(37)-N6)-threonylcarbamoyltransferase complex ATPase subunit type 1 TsaE [Chitinimonas arctica]|uniref:tRNA threonylcarbamoyladenosine biosynthesis protein TsaE n=1 Tax=Chitinimonas arctica TaxID=2594795 RepID=A0A516SDM2_9NEIS|nr:tRNA (adenosine(37)-N6)-threonylcarbamoyltransferase complex ATPase subunit type 1 TsaE [Chitinimonas arctica]QDQ26241.1 tRNA (adenosine(37)-N6)-threonylcarbamoyltransferase complex ATPase subunit type 1 TsaE [Chitinimonas arctica]
MHSQDHTLSAFLPDEAATLAMGEVLAQALRGGLVIFLQGDLGAGKTTLTRGILRGLGYVGRVKSPTYTLVEPYVVSNLYFHHFDLYRFADQLEWEDAGFREMFNPASVCLVEWPDKAADLLPQPDWTVDLLPQAQGRAFRLVASTPNGAACLATLTASAPTPPAA